MPSKWRDLIGMIFLVAVLSVLYTFIIFISFKVFSSANAAPPTPAPTQVSQFGPDISHCFRDEETRELWDCIRFEEE